MFLSQHDQWVVVNVAADAIDVATDYPRRDLGDLAGLRDSIAELGLLAPIVVSTEMELRFGLRRLVACRDLLGWRTVPVIVTDAFDEPLTAALAARDENERRKGFTPSEAVVVADQVAALVAPLAGEREKAGVKLAEAEAEVGYGRRLGVIQGGQADPVATWPQGSSKTREVAASATGYSATTLRRASRLLALAKDEGLPEPVREQVQEQVARMDATGQVNGPLRKAQEAIADYGTERPADEPAKTASDEAADEPVRRAWQEAATATAAMAKALDSAQQALTSSALAETVVEDADLDQVEHAAQQALTMVRQLRRERAGLVAVDS